MASLFTGAAANRSGAKRRHTEEEGDPATQGSAGPEVAWGLSKTKLDDLTMRVAQVVSLHDVQIRETKACLLRRVRMPATGKYGKRFVEVDKQWKASGEKHEAKGPWGANTSGWLLL